MKSTLWKTPITVSVNKSPWMKARVGITIPEILEFFYETFPELKAKNAKGAKMWSGDGFVEYILESRLETIRVLIRQENPKRKHKGKKKTVYMT